MPLAINYNSSAMTAYRNLNATQLGQTTEIQRLSSGLRINTAADDPSGFVQSTSIDTQVQSLTQAIRNSNDGINVAKTAEAALNEVTNLLQQMRTLAVHASNTGVNGSNEITADQTQLDNAVTSIDRIASTTKFNGKALLDGTYTSQIFQIGANSTDTVSLSITNQNTTTLGVNSFNLTTSPGAAISLIDAAISTVSTTRATIGAFQKNTLESNVRSITIAKENLASTVSTIRDADMAVEMSQFAKNNILLQAGTAMLAQANQQPSEVLQLLR